MKKLMIAALAVAMGGVVVAATDDDPCSTKNYCGFAYRLKLAGKTVVAKSLTKGSAKTCDYEWGCWAKPASYRVAGYIYGGFTTENPGCAECECNTFATLGDELWFWNANKEQVEFKEVSFEVFDVLRNGGLKNKAQIGIKMDDLYLAGFGAFNPESRKLKSANGFFAGTLETPKCGDIIGCEYQETGTAQVFAPCKGDVDWVSGDAAKVIAYGRWSLTYRQDKVDAIRGGADIEKTLTPAKFVKADAETETPVP